MHIFQKQSIDPLGSKLPALERSILKFRAMQILLVMFYAEELKRHVLGLIQSTDRLMALISGSKNLLERVPKGTKNAVDKALNALVADGAITVAEKSEIVGLIDYRNIIGHEIHNLFVDMSIGHFARHSITHTPDSVKEYDYAAVGRLQHFRNLFNELYKTHSYVTPVSSNSLKFKAAERTFLAEIKLLDRKISWLTIIRQSDINNLNSELSLEGTEFEGDWHPRHPLNQYDNGRLTKRGVEICYCLFDMGKSIMAVAHLTGLSLIAARRRQRMWMALGGPEHTKVDIATIPHRRFYARRED